jgi:hypothetical protein
VLDGTGKTIAENLAGVSARPPATGRGPSARRAIYAQGHLAIPRNLAPTDQSPKISASR